MFSSRLNVSANLSFQNQQAGDNKIIKQSVSKENHLTSWDQKRTPTYRCSAQQTQAWALPPAQLQDLGLRVATASPPAAVCRGTGLRAAPVLLGARHSPLLNDRAPMGYSWLNY